MALRYWLAGPAGALPDDRTRTGFQSFLVASLGADGRAVSTELTRIDSLKANEARADKRQRLTWIGLKNRFFATILAADGDGATIPNGIAEMRRPTVRRDGLDLPADVKELIARTQRKPDDGLADAPEVLFNVWADDQPIHPNEARVHGYRFYGGPAETKRLEAADARFQGVVVYTWGWLDPLARIIVTLLGWIHAVVANYGVAMILLTLLIKTLMHPLTRRMYLSSQKMQLVQPLVKEIRRKYANDQQRASQEMMKLYKEHQINPAGGCLPLLVQMPIFFALYGAFSQSFSLRQASFIPKWITDLSVPDSVFTFAKDIPLLSSPEISLLPALYLALQFYQMSLQPKSADPQVQQQQKIMKFMPLVFVFIFYAMPSGLVLYFAASSLYSVIESLHIRRKFPPIVPGTAGAGVEDGQPVATAGVRGHAGIGIGPHQARGGKKRKKR